MTSTARGFSASTSSWDRSLPARLADLVVIRGDPIAQPAEIRQITIVFKDGVGYDSAKLIASVKGLVGIR